ncbi:inositol polyphosphate kinase-domain-containing protein [Clohesyomyces aquaticus]|uniref:Kinase n=1 Tax=Clohesyomyces aquaticus TaxID=1231657 RepID=A0A1Y1ZI15_9PLEO|nr:inositol polyphosphate kinase-domain-containing protein [Clohesyomyces aquaticus]
MPKKTFDPSNLQAFGNAAAGHDGVLSDESGSVVVKPCTPAEIAFYESVAADHPDLAPHLPKYMGTLSLGADAKLAVAGDEESGMIQTANGIERLHGRKLDTEMHIVLENITHGFKKPNVLDLKLGAQLWDEAAKPEKRARLDEVSSNTTSGSLGFRIAGMRTYMGESVPEIGDGLKEYVEQVDESSFWVFNKMYGRKFNTKDIVEGFVAYVLPTSKSKVELERAEEVLEYFLDQVTDIQKVFESKESRMYSASILLVFEGDLDEYAKTKKTVAAAARKEVTGEDDDDDEDLPKLAAVKMIDFAHATWHPGQGPDENALRGIRSTATILKDLLDQVKADLTKA